METVDQTVLAQALDRQADRYMEALEDLFSPHSTANRDRIVAAAQLLVRCHEMYEEALRD